MNQKKFEEKLNTLTSILGVNLYPAYMLSDPYSRGIYAAAKELVTAYEENDEFEGWAKVTLSKSRTQIDVEIDRCDYREVRQIIEKICEDHEGKRDLHITIKNLQTYCSDLSQSNECKLE